MNVDLLSALDARRAERPQAGRATDPGEFPQVLRSSLDGTRSWRETSARDDSEGRRDAVSDDGDRARESAATQREGEARSSSERELDDGGDRREEEESEAGARDLVVSRPPGYEERDAAELREDAVRGGEDETARELAEETGEAAILAAAATAIASEARPVVDAAASENREGRLTALDVDGQDPGDHRGAVTRDLVEAAETDVDEALDDEAEAQARAVLVASGLGREGPPEVANETADVAPVSTRGGAAAIEAPVVAELPPSSEETVTEMARGGDSDQQESPERETRQDGGERTEIRTDVAEQTGFDRAAEGSLAAAVDPGLREAIARQEEVQRAPEAITLAGGVQAASPVAGTVTETTPAAPGVPQPAVASDAISVQTEWLATRGGGSARLVLHPPELGEIAIRVTLRSGAVDVVMVAQEAVAQSVAEEQSERLAQALQARDLRMEQFEVRRGDPDSLGEGPAGRFAESGAEHEAREEDQGAGGRDRGDVGSGMAGRRDTGAETAPHILSAGREAGVDLRI